MRDQVTGGGRLSPGKFVEYACALLVSFWLFGCGVDPKEVAESRREATDTLFDLLKEKEVEGNLAAAAVEVLEETNDPRLTRAFVEALSRESGIVAFRAIRALGRSGDPRANGPLQALLDDERWDLFFRIEAAIALERLGNPGTASLLAEALKGEKAGHVRSNAAGGLGRLGNPEWIADLRVAFQEDADSLVQASAAVALARLEDRESLPAIGRRLLEPNAMSVDMILITSLEAFGDSTAARVPG